MKTEEKKIQNSRANCLFSATKQYLKKVIIESSKLLSEIINVEFKGSDLDQSDFLEKYFSFLKIYLKKSFGEKIKSNIEKISKNLLLNDPFKKLDDFCLLNSVMIKELSEVEEINGFFEILNNKKIKIVNDTFDIKQNQLAKLKLRSSNINRKIQNQINILKREIKKIKNSK